MRWQDVRDMGLNLFKKRSRSRTLWVGGSISIFGLLSYILLLTGISETHTGDIYCDDVCESYVNVTTTYWRICFQSDFEFVDTEPHVRTELYVPTYGKKWRPFNSDKDCIDRGGVNKFKIVGYKEPHETVKWSFNTFGVDIDPVWFATTNNKYVGEVEIRPNIFKIERCTNASRTEYFTCFDNNWTYIHNYTFINNKTKINESRTDYINHSVGSNCKPYKAYYKSDCDTIGIRNTVYRLDCLEGYRCDVVSDDFCMLNCNDGDCNYNAKQSKNWGWTYRCNSIYDIKQIKFNNKITASVVKI